MPKNKPRGYDPLWAKAKQVCRLNMEDIRMAKELGMSPKSLMKNNPSPRQPWKEPVKYWIRGLYETCSGRKQLTSGRGAEVEAKPAGVAQTLPCEESVHF